MDVVARISKTWSRKSWLMALILIFFAGWHFRDGLFYYPELNRSYTAHQELEKAGKLEDWEGVAKLHNWPIEPPKKFYSSGDLGYQIVVGVICTLAVAATIGWFYVSKARSIRFDGDTIIGETGQTVKLAEVIDLDLKKWDSKGIAFAIFKRDGKTDRLKIDDYKYEGAIAIVGAIQTHLVNTGRWEAKEPVNSLDADSEAIEEPKSSTETSDPT